VHVDRVATALLIVERVVLDIADDALFLKSLHFSANQFTGKDGVFALIFEDAAVARLARQVHAAAERHVVSLIAQLRGDERAIFARRVEIPTGGRGHAGWKRRRIAAIECAACHAGGGIRHLQVGDAEARNAGNETCATHRSRRRRVRAGENQLPTAAMQQRDLFVESHPGDDQVGATVGREGFIHPGPSGIGARGTGLGSSAAGENHAKDGRERGLAWARGKFREHTK